LGFEKAGVADPLCFVRKVANRAGIDTTLRANRNGLESAEARMQANASEK
jgi:hypothetical protein